MHTTTKDAAAKLGKSVRTIHRMVAAGELHPVGKAPGVRGAYLLDADEVERVAARLAAKSAA